MKTLVHTLILIVFLTPRTHAQTTFKAGWDTYKTHMIIHEYTYDYMYNDSFMLSLFDSSTILIAPDSAVVLKSTYPMRDKYVYKTINYFNAKKQVTKTEEYKGDNMVMMREWRYDDKNRKNYSYEENKVTGKNYKRNYEYSTDKKTGDLIVTESQYYNGRIEFYTKSYYNKHNVKYKEVRLNDNNRDVIHIESYTYDADGNMTERSVYFPEFKVTKKFPGTSSGGDEAPKCMKTFPLAATEKVYLPGKHYYLRNFLRKMEGTLSDPACTTFMYRYVNFVNEVIVCTSKVNTGRQIILRYKERV